VTTRALVDAAQQFAKALAGDSTSGLRELLAGIVVRITIQQDSIEVHVSKEGTRARLLNQEGILGQDSDGQPIVLTVAMKLKRCGGEMRLIIPGGAAIDQQRQPVPSLIKAISRASDWIRRMEIGECKHQRDLAKAMKLEPPHLVCRLCVPHFGLEVTYGPKSRTGYHTARAPSSSASILGVISQSGTRKYDNQTITAECLALRSWVLTSCLIRGSRPSRQSASQVENVQG
jgi:hypothetical protein